MTTHTRRVNLPAYYLGRPAALWLAALTPAVNATSPKSVVLAARASAAGC